MNYVKLCGQRGAEFGGQFGEGFGQYPRVGEHRHEIGVARPARHDMDVQMLGDARARRAAQIEADVETFGLHHLRQGVLATADKLHEAGQFLVRKAVQIKNLLVGDDHQMAASIGEFIEQRVARAVARDDEIRNIVIGLGDLGEQGHARGRGLGSDDVMDSPGCVEHFHAGTVMSRGGNVKEGKVTVGWKKQGSN